MSYSVLIIEDEPSLTSALVKKFNHEGFATLTATNGQQGLDLAKQKHPNLILLDLVMPGMDGMTMINELRKDPWGKDAKVIVLTNLTDPAKKSALARQNISDYLIKADLTLGDIFQIASNKLAI